MLLVLKRMVSMDGSFEHPKHMLKLMGKKEFTILRSKICLSKPVIQYSTFKISMHALISTYLVFIFMDILYTILLISSHSSHVIVY